MHNKMKTFVLVTCIYFQQNPIVGGTVLGKTFKVEPYCTKNRKIKQNRKVKKKRKLKRGRKLGKKKVKTAHFERLYKARRKKGKESKKHKRSKKIRMAKRLKKSRRSNKSKSSKSKENIHSTTKVSRKYIKYQKLSGQKTKLRNKSALVI